MEEARGWPRDRPGAGLWHAFVHRGFLMQARRERMLCRNDARRSVRGASERRVGVGSQPGHSFPSRLAIVCGAKSVPKPTPSARCHPGFPHRCATEEALAGLSSAFIRLHLRLEHAGRGGPAHTGHAPQRGRREEDGQAQGPAPTMHRAGIGELCRGGPPCPPSCTHEAGAATGGSPHDCLCARRPVECPLRQLLVRGAKR